MIKGRILKGISGFYYVCDEHSRIFVCKAKGVFRNMNIKPLVGDYVEIEIIDEAKYIANVVNVLPRRNNLLRPYVANVDMALIVFSISDPSPSFLLLDKLLVYYKMQNIPVTICFNKSDLSNPCDIETIKNMYKDSCVELIFTSFINKKGLDEFKDVLNNKTTVITGPSGVGKSTLINLLIPAANMKTGNLSKKLGRGKHTTRHAEIFALNEDTYILDTPGFTSFDLEDLKRENLDKYYPEFDSFREECKFIDCSHISENDCSVKNALKCGKINNERYNNYSLIYNKLKNPTNRR